MSERNYELESARSSPVPAPVLDYGPPGPREYRPKIGLIGCGGITEQHLKAYRSAGWEVAAFYDARPDAAERRRSEYYPQAKVCRTVGELLESEDIDVVDIATHPEVRVPLIEEAIAAGKHVLSQKPFVLDLTEGARLVSLAEAAGVKLAVNQNGRWAPYFSYMRQAVRAGLIGDVSSVNIALNWDHSWTAGTAFEKIHHLVLFDFGIHWFDAAYSFFGGGSAHSVHASLAAAPDQTMDPPLIASSIVTFDQGIANLAFNAHSRFGQQESCVVVGTKGTLRAVGAVCAISAVEITTDQGMGRAKLAGSWFPDGFRGSMGELLRSIEEDREPENSATDNLKSLSVCLAAMKSADDCAPVLIHSDRFLNRLS